MEQKKIIMVAISVGVFLVIAIGAAILVFGTENNAPAMARARTIPAGTSMVPGYTFPGDYSQPHINGDGATESDQDENAGSGIEIAANTDNDGSSGSGSITIANGNTTSDITINENASTVISVARPSTTAVPDVAPTPRQTPQTTARTTPTAATQNSSSSAASSSSSSSAPAAVPAAATARSTPRISDNFWIQAGSFSTVGRAEGVKETLESKGITSIIENRVVDGTMYYRVRIGPYTSRNEADYWLSLVKSISGFESSQIWQTPAVQ